MFKSNKMENRMKEFRRKIEVKADQFGFKIESFVGFRVQNENGNSIYFKTLIEVDDYLNKSSAPSEEMKRVNPFLANVEISA